MVSCLWKGISSVTQRQEADTAHGTFPGRCDGQSTVQTEIERMYETAVFSDAERLRIDLFFVVLCCMCEGLTNGAGKEMCRHQLHY